MNNSVMQNIVRIGTVSSVNADNRTARVAFADKAGLVSGDLKVVKNTCSPNCEGDSCCSLSPWLPQVGELVLCVFLPNGEGHGFVVGSLEC